MLLTSLLRIVRPVSPRPRRRPATVRPAVESLDGRDLPSADGLLAPLVPTALPAHAHHGHDGPFQLVEHGSATFGADGVIRSEGSGEATHLGKFTLVREATLGDPTDGGFEVKGQATLTAANGDQLFATIGGTFNPATGQGVLIYEWVGGTGRFADATGTTTWLVTLHPDLTYDVVADGVINY